MSIAIRLLHQGRPLRRTMLRHRSPRSGAAAGWSMTDDEGRTLLPGSGATAVLVQPLAHTSVAAMSGRRRRHASAPVLLRDGDEHMLPPTPDLSLMMATLDAYDRGLRGFAPFRAAADPDWPLTATSTGSPRGLLTPVVALLYPDRSPARLPFVEPAAPPLGRPRIRLQRGNVDPAGRPLDPAVLAHELAHALHFSLMPTRVRVTLESRYAAWIAARVATGQDPTHAAERRTTAFVAWLEAFGLFAERYDRFVTGGAGGELSARQAHFVATELTRWQHLIDDPDPAVEGSVYATAILQPAQEASLATAVADYLGSARHGVLDPGAYAVYRQHLRR